MKPDFRHALALAVERGLGLSADQSNCLFLNAQPVPWVANDWKSDLACEQGFRPTFLDLQAQGYSVVPEIPEDQSAFSGAMVCLGRNRRLNEHWVTRAFNALNKGGRLLVAGNKTDGVAPIRKWSDEHFSVVDSFSKFHAVIFWVEKTNGKQYSLPGINAQMDQFEADEGMFSAGKVDKGSALLTEYFDQRIAGRVVDLGAGWGYLSCILAETTPRVTSIDLFEADHASLQAAKRNLTSLGSEKSFGFHWIDVTTEFPKKPYDWVIMNPPFHDGRAANSELGKRFIEVAASTLISGGRLLMVANQNLPYEKTLTKVFRRYETLCNKDGFKVIEAVR